MPIRNVEVLENLGIKDKPARQKVQAIMANVAAAHLIELCPNTGGFVRDKINLLIQIRPGLGRWHRKARM